MFMPPRIALYLALMILLAPLLPGQSPAQPASGDAAVADSITTITTTTFDIDMIDAESLLDDPLAGRPELRQFHQRRAWLAHREGNAADFEQVAAEFNAIGAHFSAVQILWFAEKLAPAGPARDRIRGKLVEYHQAYRAIDTEARQGVEFWDQGRRQKAVEFFQEFEKQHPFYEQSYFHLADFYYQQYLERESQQATRLDPRVRAGIFRNCHERIAATLAIDPLFDQAYYIDHRLRDLLPDHREFLRLSQPLSERSLDFRGKVLAPFEAVNDGALTQDVLGAMARGLETVEQYPYAVYTWQVALAQPGCTREQAKVIRDHIANLLVLKLPLTPTPEPTPEPAPETEPKP